MNKHILKFRFNDDLLIQMAYIKDKYKFKHNGDLAKSCVKLVCRLIIEKEKTTEEQDITIDDIFDNYADTDEVFDWIKPKRALNKTQTMTLDEYIEEGGTA